MFKYLEDYTSCHLFPCHPLEQTSSSYQRGPWHTKYSNFLMQNAVIVNAVSWNCVLPKIHALKLCWYLKEGPLEVTGHEGGTLWKGLVFQQKTSECSSVTCHWQKEGGFCKLKELHTTPTSTWLLYIPVCTLLWNKCLLMKPPSIMVRAAWTDQAKESQNTSNTMSTDNLCKLFTKSRLVCLQKLTIFLVSLSEWLSH